jgi:hypothetical protein
MESRGADPRPSAEEARHQLEDLGEDRRWSTLVRSTPEIFQIYLAGGCIASLVLYGLSYAGVGFDPSEEGTMAMVIVMIPLLGQGQILHKHSGSVLGTPGKRPQVREVLALVASYILGLVVVLWVAHEGWWPLVVVPAVGVGWVAAWASGRWIRRYREEFGYRGLPHLWRWIVRYAVFMGGFTMLFSGLWQLLSTWYSHL